MADEHPNGVLARVLWSAIADADTERARACLAPAVVWSALGRNPLSGEYHGPDGVLDYLARVGERADELSSELEAVYAGDDGAVLRYRVRARRQLRRLEMQFLVVFSMRDGLIVSAVSVPFDQAANDTFWN